MKLGHSSYRTDPLGTIETTCPRCGRVGGNQLERTYATLDMFGFIPARYADLTYQQRCLACGQRSQVPRPAAAPPMPFAYRFGWMFVLVAVVGACSLYLLRMGACRGPRAAPDPAIASEAYDAQRQDAMIAVAKPLVAELRAAERACTKRVLAIQQRLAPDPVSFKDRPPVAIEALKDAKPLALPGEGGLVVDPWFIHTDALCKIDISDSLAAYGAGGHTPGFMDVSAEMAATRAKLATLVPAVVVVTAWRCAKKCRAGAVWISVEDSAVLAAATAETTTASTPTAALTDALATGLRSASDWKYE